jgi:DNA-binding CsgD family transcriptional regulator
LAGQPPQIKSKRDTVGQLSVLQITRREQETLGLLSDGFDTKEIANRMGISNHTAKSYVRMVMVKMGVSSRMEILAKTLSMNLPSRKPAWAHESGQQPNVIFEKSNPTSEMHGSRPDQAATFSSWRQPRRNGSRIREVRG